MKIINASEIHGFEKRFRTSLINSLSGFKSANLIGSVNASGLTNLAVFSSVFHLGSDPALLGMITRPNTVERDTYQNITGVGFFTINHISEPMVERAHQTSARYPKHLSEFDECGFEAEYLSDFKAPFVKESPVKIGCALEETYFIKANGTELLVGRIEMIALAEDFIGGDGYLDLAKMNIVTISSLDAYHSVENPNRYTYAKPNSDPKKVGNG